VKKLCCVLCVWGDVDILRVRKDGMLCSVCVGGRGYTESA
jgi:hypothetical protein